MFPHKNLEVYGDISRYTANLSAILFNMPLVTQWVKLRPPFPRVRPPPHELTVLRPEPVSVGAPQRRKNLTMQDKLNVCHSSNSAQ